MFDRVKLPSPGRHPIEEIIASGSAAETAPQEAPPVEATQPSQTSAATQTRQSRQTTPSSQTRQSIAPERDYARVANSITREAVPAGLFRGKSKQLYDQLYALTRGAVIPKRKVRAARARLMQMAHIGSRVTFDSNVVHLQQVGLIRVTVFAGEHAGNEYEVFLPEEISTPPSPTRQSSQTGRSSPAQKPDGLDTPESSQTSQAPSGEAADIYSEPKTFLKTSEEKADDEAFARFVKILRQASREVTGKESPASEADKWKEVGDLLAAELRHAASRTEMVSSAPALLLEHLRRRLTNRTPMPQRAAQPAPPAQPSPAPTPPTDEELVGMFVQFLHDGMTIEEIDGQLAGSVEADRWPRIREAALERYEREKEQTGQP
jgi:hypothetical protein